MYSLAVHVYPTSIRATGIGWALATGRSGGVFSSYTGEWALAAGGSAAFFGLIAAAMATVYAALAMVRRHIPRSMPRALYTILNFAAGAWITAPVIARDRFGSFSPPNKRHGQSIAVPV